MYKAKKLELVNDGDFILPYITLKTHFLTLTSPNLGGAGKIQQYMLAQNTYSRKQPHYVQYLCVLPKDSKVNVTLDVVLCPPLL